MPPDPRSFQLFEIPDREAQTLEVAPRLASWMARGHPDQIRLSAFLAHAEALIEAQGTELTGPLAIRLDVGLPTDVPLLNHHDLDNYLFPLVTRLGSRRFVSAWATKAHSPTSSIRIDQARIANHPSSTHAYEVYPAGSAEKKAWKEGIQAQLAGASELPAGPVDLQIAYRVGPGRNWANLWKPTIDALGPILGSDSPGHWNPRDGRIVRLGLHLEVDPSLRHDVQIAIFGSTV